MYSEAASESVGRKALTFQETVSICWSLAFDSHATTTHEVDGLGLQPRSDSTEFGLEKLFRHIRDVVEDDDQVGRRVGKCLLRIRRV